MTGLSALISKYHHIERSHQLGGIIGQLDRAAHLASEELGADFTALFYRRRDDDVLIPVACNHRPNVCITSLDLLDSQLGRFGPDDNSGAPEVIRLTDDPQGDPALYDPFAAANNLTYRQVIVLSDGGSSTAMIAAYWRSKPAEISPETTGHLRLLLELMSGTMSIADRLHVANDFSVRMAQVLSVLEMNINDPSSTGIASNITSLTRTLIPGCGVCFLSKGIGDERFNVVELADPSASSPDLAERIGEAIRALDDSLPDEGRLDAEAVVADISDLCPGLGTASVSVDMTPDEDHRRLLVVWTHRPTGFTPNDLELLSALALATRSVMQYALQLRYLHKSKRILEKSSARMADTEALAALTDMTTGIAHDFNNIMGGIVGRVQLMKMNLHEGPILSGLNTVESLAMEGAETVRRIQEFTRRTRNKKLEPVNLADIVRNCVDSRPSSWKKVAEAANITVKYSHALDEAYVEGNDDDLVTLLNKLIENAVEHSPEGSCVAINLESDSQRVVLTVADRGDGIPDDIRKKVFYPFFTTKAKRGAGLGLAIAHGVVISHGGKIEVGNGAEGGAVFKVSFMAVDRVDEESDITGRIGQADRLRILVVDDDEQIREVLSDMLTIDGHSATACADGYQALEAVDEQSFDLIITDLGMPGMSGLDLAAVVHEKFPQLPIAMITGWGTQLDEEDVSLKGIKTVLPKPFHLKDVKALVRELTTS